ncbi:MAG: hypothetical protein GY725_21595 [bacterium]|nr:hypothetical protein [bacterium]
MTHRRRPDLFALVVCLVATAYVAQAWSPSSYGVVLERFGAKGAGLIAGTPLEARADEWSIWTPQFQAVVNNDFERINRTSIYREDLRNYNALPLADWGLVFKPYHWPFFVFDAAHAFSFAHAFFIVMFLLGFRQLFRVLGLSQAEAALAALLLFFTGCVQAWWTTLGPLWAGFPWMLVLASAPLSPWVKATGLAYLSASWLLAHLYPPQLISLAFAAVVLLLAFRRDVLRPANLAVCAGGTALGLAIVLLYLWEPLQAMAATVFPGERVSDGGGQSSLQWWSQLLPYLARSGNRALANGNICEASTIGSYLPLFCLLFLDHRGLLARWRSGDAAIRALLRDVAPLLVAVLLCSLWMLWPIPSALGRILLWDQVPPSRMWFTCGLLIFALALRLLGLPLRVTPVRIAVCATVVLGAAYGSEVILGQGSLLDEPAEGAVLLPLLFGGLLMPEGSRATRQVLLGVTLFANLAGFALFNPIQSAKPIFERPVTPITRNLDEFAARHARGWLVLDGIGVWGSVLNGWGWAAPAHVLIRPRMPMFRTWFPSLPEHEFEQLFNRFLHVKLTSEKRPTPWASDGTVVPVDVFDPPEIPVLLASGVATRHPGSGEVNYQKVYAEDPEPYALIIGWSEFVATDPEAQLRVTTNMPVLRAFAVPVLRQDVARGLGSPEHVASGFSLRLDLAPGWRDVVSPRFCIVSRNRDGEEYLLPSGSGCEAMEIRN